MPLFAFYITNMKRYFLVCLSMILTCATMLAQDRKVQNRPYTDLRPFHFGIHVGTHMQDMDFINAGPITITDEEGNVHNTYYSCDQDRIDPGFNVGVLGEFRLTENFQLRIAPAIYFGSRHVTFHNMNTGEDVEQLQRQDIKSALITSAFDLIFAAPRCNNHRAYMFAGYTPTLNLTGKDTDYLRLKPIQNFIEVGFGFDEYLPFFKCRPELKFMFGLGNALDMKHPGKLKDKNMLACANSVSSASAKMITLSFFFE